MVCVLSPSRVGRWIALAVAGAALVLILITAAGFFRSPLLSAEASVEIARPPQAVWDFVSNMENVPRWSTEVKNVTKVSDEPKRYRMTGTGGTADVEIIAFEPPRRYVSRMAESSMGTSGEWEITVDPVGENARVTSRMKMRLDNPFFRGMTMFFDAAKAERATLLDLKKHLESRAY